MTKLILVAATLVAIAATATEAAAARNVPSRHSQTTAQSERSVTDCVRAPNVGSFATAPYTQPPCLPGTAY